MSLRAKKTLAAGLRAAALLTVITVLRFAQGVSASSTTVWLAVFVTLDALIAGYTWWFFGESPKAVALRAKADAKTANRIA
jgi:hypothetical protein